MPAAPFPPDESDRLAALRASRLVDSPLDPATDRLTRQAAAVCETPVAAVSLVAEKRQWFKSRVGTETTETPRDQSICAHAILTPDRPLIVPDASADPRFADNPLVAGRPGIRFYAGIPLRSPEGYALGTLCVTDYQPREISAAQIDKLKAIAQQISIRLTLQRPAPDEHRLALGFGLVCALLVGMSVFAALQARQFLSSERWVAHTNLVIRVVEQTLFELQAAESSQRGFSATGQEDFLPPFEAAAAATPGRLTDLRSLVSDNPEQLRRCDRFGTAVAAKLAVTRERITQRKELGVAALDASHMNGQGRRAMEIVIRVGREMIETENALLRQRAAARDHGLYAATAALLSAGLLGTALLAGGFWLTRRELRRRQALGSALERANAGLETEIAERRQAQERLAVQHAVTHVAAGSVSLEEAAPRFLEEIGSRLRWQVGELWTVDAAAGVMRLAQGWHFPSPANDGFVAESRGRTLAKGQGLPGRAWRDETPAWETDLANSPVFLRTAAALQAGLRRAYAFPLRDGDGGAVSSVVVFLGDEIGAPDPDLAGAMSTLAGVISQFAERCGAEVGLRASQHRFTAFMENAPAIAYIKDEAGRMLYGNQTLLRRFDLTSEQWLGKTDFDLWPAMAPALRAHDAQVLAGGQAVRLKETVPTTDGAMSYWISYKFPLREENSGRTLLAGMSIDITDHERAEAALRASLREKETLLQEVHHRVKNNLQIIGSLLSMQARRTRSAAALEALGESAGRVRSIALVHEKLYRSTDLERIDAADYLRTLSRNLMDAIGGRRQRPGAGRISLDFELEDGHLLDASLAIACGLIVNEALTNACKHAFPNGRAGRVVVALGEADDPVRPGRQLFLEVRDDGVGLPPESFSPGGMTELSRNSLGTRLVRDLSKQAGGRLDCVSSDPATGEGLTVRVTFPARFPAPASTPAPSLSPALSTA